MTEVWNWIESSELAFQIGATWWFPLLESIHVLALAFLLGAILMLDLRLIGWTARRYSLEALAAGMLGWAWLGFALAVVTGIGMFISRPAAYAANPAFQIKLLLLLVAGGNLFLYRYRRDRHAGLSNEKLAGALSLLVWMGIVLAGRWTGHIN